MIMKPVHQAKKYKNRFHKWFDETWAVIVLLAMVAFTIGPIIKEAITPVENHFVKYENATTLVKVMYGEKSSPLGYSRALGFMDDETYKSYRDGEDLKGKVEIYHPYVRGRSTIFDIETIISVNKMTYDSFYSSDPPYRWSGE